ncbi:MAG TPA: hypothetical protein VKL19_06745 [Thermoanaerobaculia bacterium]|nr:hypothetical protein [Thermoanaerobaculia bacterium]
MAARRVVLALLLATAAGLIAAFGFFYFRDNFATHYPVKTISARMLRAGEIPWWNFYDDGGQPLAGNPNTLTFYPDNFLYLILPPHVAFNLHFLLHLALAWVAMRALCRQAGVSPNGAAFAATMYAMSGLAISATVFYNLITAVALIPFALWAVERLCSAPRRAGAGEALIVGAAFGLIGLAGEPVVVVSTAICAVILAMGRLDIRRAAIVAAALLIAGAIVSPQLIAYVEIAKEVERVRGFSALTALNASLLPRRVAEIAIGPIVGFLTDAGRPEFRGRLFSTVFLGIIVVPAIVVALRRRLQLRYVVIAAVMLFLALGRYNPIVKAMVESTPALRIARYPEKFTMALIAALVVIAAAFFDRLSAKWRLVWGFITFLPLVLCVVHGTPIDWFSYYRVGAMPPLRICGSEHIEWGTRPAREEYRHAAHTMPPIFGAVAGLRYGVHRSPEGMHSLMSRIVAERAAATPQQIRLHYLRMSGCAVEGGLPAAWIVPRAIGVGSVNEEVNLIESGAFDEHTSALAPAAYANFASPAAARITRYGEGLQDIFISVSTPAPALMLVNQSFFRAWSARSGGRELTTLPLDIDRLGVIVPAGQHEVLLQFGRHRTAIVVAWILSSLLLLAGALALRIEVFDGRTGKVERAADENVAQG